MANTQTISKTASKAPAKAAKAPTARAKAATVQKAPAAAKSAPAPTGLIFAAALAAALAGKFGNTAKAYYTTATKYHAGKKTTFPRAGETFAAAAAIRTTVEKATPAEQEKVLQSVLEKAIKGVLPSRSAEGNAVFDLMMMQTSKASK